MTQSPEWRRQSICLRRPQVLCNSGVCPQCVPLDHKENLHVKTIAQTRYTTAAVSPHQFSYVDGSLCVDEGGTPVRVAADRTGRRAGSWTDKWTGGLHVQMCGRTDRQTDTTCA
jgi:hypothetical protein